MRFITVLFIIVSYKSELQSCVVCLKCLSASPVPQTGVPGVHHSIFGCLHLGRSSQRTTSGLLRFWDSLNFKKDNEFMRITVLFLDEKVNSVIHGFISAGRANQYMLSLKVGSIVKVDRFEVARCSSMYKIIDHPFLIRFISPTIIDEVITGAHEINLQSLLDYVVGQFRFVHVSDLTKEITRIVIRLLIDPEKKIATPRDTRDNLDRHKDGNNISTCSLLLSYENSLHVQCQQVNIIVFLYEIHKFVYNPLKPKYSELSLIL
ncbi:hypothetical protein IGI04_026123 [Brassica rapa subsp. trilocularis]|uniref:DUF223 domain-containing protein n=1 Tax=Brassica rapa subsp. trilocularis TaxID=1813537 RepID=A0ABQ7KXP7_BRACM|nr:hypothetical protein IGI04_026123 [Brassica rapa subsp. trilocularis]